MSPSLLSDRQGLEAHLTSARRQGRRVAVVLTMGALHRGHQALVREAARQGEEVVVTVFVNPTQFGVGEDFDKYPRDLETDVQAAGEAGATAVFAPHADEMYPPGEETRVSAGRLGGVLCGAFRPDHFTGVLTVVAKFFHLFPGATFVFGRKDYQQLILVRRMAVDLFFPVEVVDHEIVRESDGLAMSSRNVYLSASERQAARAIPRALGAANTAFSSGERNCGILREIVQGALHRACLAVDYVELADPDSLESHGDEQMVPERCLLAVAARCGSTRLIDNLVLGVDSSPRMGGA